MVKRSQTIHIASIAIAAIFAGCTGEKPTPTSTTPAGGAKEAPTVSAPKSPLLAAGWKIVEDPTFSAADIASLSNTLGVELLSLKNTVYDVNGKRVKVNTMKVADAAAADALMEALAKTGKPKEFVLRKDLVIYEFVCKNDAIPEAREGRKLLGSN